MNNLPLKPRKIGERISVLDRLHLKQAEIARKSGKPVPADGGGRRYGAEKKIRKEEDALLMESRHLPLFCNGCQHFILRIDVQLSGNPMRAKISSPGACFFRQFFNS